MGRIHSHYENLKVARDAPLEVIKAAYRALAQKYHPDVNKSPDAPRIMILLNEAWAVLGEPSKRVQHDRWLLEAEASRSNSSTSWQPNAEPKSAADDRTFHTAQPRKAASTRNQETSTRRTSQSAADIAEAHGFGRWHAPRPAHSPTDSPARWHPPNAVLAAATIAFAVFILWVWSNRAPAKVETPRNSIPGALVQMHSEPLLPVHLSDGLSLGTNERPPLSFSSEAKRREYRQWLNFAGSRLRSTMATRERVDLLESVWYESHRAGIDVSLALALIERASNFDASRIGAGGAIGYMQIGPGFRQQFGKATPDPLLDPRSNIRAGARLLRYYLDISNGEVPLSLQRYRDQTHLIAERPTEAVSRLFATQVLEAMQHWNPPSSISPSPPKWKIIREEPDTPARGKGSTAFDPSTAVEENTTPRGIGDPPQRATAESPIRSRSAAGRPIHPQVADTGYLVGEPRIADGGRSTFTVDNKSSSGNAEVRLYLGETSPAVRAIFVRRGESFTIGSLQPGSYVLRYRFSDRKGTFKAGELFRLHEEETAEGIRYSTVRVTLYTVQNGNLRMTTVPDSEF